MHNVFACLVHENRACVVDLVRNLRCLDPSSTVLLYNGGADPELLTHGFPFGRLGAVVHPRPRRMAWGRLHDFALDCMRFALQHLPCDALTVVDSDQLAVRPGYSDYLAAFLRDRPRVGVLASDPRPQPSNSAIPPAASALREFERWRPFLQRFPDGERKWAYWTFWPTTVFTAAAARDLTRLVDSDAQLRELLAGTQIWATEESLLPTLVAVLGHEVAANPCSHDYVRFRIAYPLEYIDGAMTRPDVFWVHPVPRRYDDPARARIRDRCRHYRRADPAMPTDPAAPALREPGLPTPALLARMKTVEGWFSEEEAVLLAGAAARAVRDLPGPPAVVEVGSYCGRCTVVLAEAARAVDPPGRVFAVDPHEGVVGALDRGLHHGPPTFERFCRTVEGSGLGAVIEPVRGAPHDVPWGRPVGLLFIDGLHDYPSVAADFHHFESHVLPGGYVAFHDYDDYFPGVKTFVDDLIAAGGYHAVGRAGWLIVLRKEPGPVPPRRQQEYE